MNDFKWQTPEYAHTEKTSDWYWTVGIISAALAVVAIIFGNPLFGIVVAIGAFTLVMFASRQPKIVAVHVNDKGVIIDKTLYPYTSLDSFYVDEKYKSGPRLILKSKKALVPLIVVPIAVDPEELRSFIVFFIKEEVFEQGLLHALLERFGF